MAELQIVSKQSNGGMAEVISSRQAQEVQAAMIIAQRFPRDTNRSFTRIMEDCKRRSLAEKAVYSYPRGNQTVAGPSIRLAETIARAWGNLDFGVIELENKPAMGSVPGESTMMAYCWDLETNTRTTKVFSVKHKRDTKKGSHQLTDERDIYEIAANNGARRLRACILSVIPSDIIDSAVQQCEKTMEGGAGPLIDRVRAMVTAFSDFGVTQEMIEARLGHRLDVTTESELVGLRKIFTSLKDNFADRSDYFDIGVASNQREQNSAESNSQETAKRAEEMPIKTVKNFAPQTAEEAEKLTTEQNQQSDSEPSQPPPAAPKGPTREDLSKKINSLVKTLKWKPKQIADRVQEVFNKSTNELTDEEMLNFSDLLLIEIEKVAT